MVDERDWFRVVAAERCEECGMRAGDIARADLGPAILVESDRWGDLLTRSAGPEEWRKRPHALAWSALEYGAHVRDVLALFGRRVAQARVEREPEFGWWDHEASALAEGYNDQDPGTVALALRTNAEQLMAELADLDGAGWQRAGTRRRGERFTVEGLARFALHEAHHTGSTPRCCSPANEQETPSPAEPADARCGPPNLAESQDPSTVSCRGSSVPSPPDSDRVRAT